MTIYNPNELVEGGIGSARKVRGLVTSCTEEEGKYGPQLVLRMEQGAEILEAEDPALVGPIAQFTEWYNIKQTKGSLWDRILKVFIDRGIPLPEGPVGKVLTMELTRIEFGVNKTTGEVIFSEPFLPVDVKGGTPVAKQPVKVGPVLTKINSPLVAKRAAQAAK